jgi:hypothetical protein
MGTAVGSAVSSDPLHVPSDSESDNELMGVMAEPAAIGERNGIGVASSDRYSS